MSRKVQIGRDERPRMHVGTMRVTLQVDKSRLASLKCRIAAIIGSRWRNLPIMLNSRLQAAGLATLAAASVAMADFDGPAPLSWRWIQPTNAIVKGSPLVDGNAVYVAVGQRAFALDRNPGTQKRRFPSVDPLNGTLG